MFLNANYLLEFESFEDLFISCFDCRVFSLKIKLTRNRSENSNSLKKKCILSDAYSYQYTFKSVYLPYQCFTWMPLNFCLVNDV